MASVTQLFGIAPENDPVLVRILTVGYQALPPEERQAIEERVIQAQMLARATCWEFAFAVGRVTFETPDTVTALFDTVQLKFHDQNGA